MRNECGRCWLRSRAPPASPPRAKHKALHPHERSFPIPIPHSCPPTRGCSPRFNRTRLLPSPALSQEGRQGGEGRKETATKKGGGWCWFFVCLFFPFKNKALPLFLWLLPPLMTSPLAFLPRAAPQAGGLHFRSPSPGAKSCKDASRSQLYPATSAQVTAPLLNYYQLLTDFSARPPPGPGFPQMLTDPAGSSEGAWRHHRLQLLLRPLS